MKIRILLTCSILVSTFSNAYATDYNLPAIKSDTVIAQYPDEDSHLIAITKQDYPGIDHITLLDVAKRYHLGQEEIVRLNPTVDRWLVREGEMVRIPNKRILPNTPRNGVTLNISEFRMYYYPPNTGTVKTYAHGIGRQDWKTPLGQTKVIRKVKNPTWNPPASIRREHAADGDPLPAVVPPGPHNPLGTRALYLSLPGEYRIHGTDIDKVYGIGMQITHGCVRMYPEDIEELYEFIPVGTPVYLVKQPIKVGWLNNVLYLEAHPDLEGENMGQAKRYQVALDLMRKANGEQLPEFDQKALNDALEKLDGEPVALYERLPSIGGEEPSLPSTITPDAIPDAQPEEPQTKTLPKPEVKTVAKTVNKPEVKNIKVVAKPVAKTTVKTTTAKNIAKTQVKVASKPVTAKNNTKVVVKTAPVPVVKAKTKSIAKANTTNTKTITKSASKTATKPTVKPSKAIKPTATKPETKLNPKTAGKNLSKLSA